MTPHECTPHRYKPYSYHGGDRFGWECDVLDCDAGGSGFYTLAAAEEGGRSHSVNNWSQP